MTNTNQAAVVNNFSKMSVSCGLANSFQNFYIWKSTNLFVNFVKNRFFSPNCILKYTDKATFLKLNISEVIKAKVTKKKTRLDLHFFGMGCLISDIFHYTASLKVKTRGHIWFPIDLFALDPLSKKQNINRTYFPINLVFSGNEEQSRNPISSSTKILIKLFSRWLYVSIRNERQKTVALRLT